MKEKRYPIGWHPANEKKPWLGLKLLKRNMKGQARLQILKNL